MKKSIKIIQKKKTKSIYSKSKNRINKSKKNLKGGKPRSRQLPRNVRSIINQKLSGNIDEEEYISSLKHSNISSDVNYMWMSGLDDNGIRHTTLIKYIQGKGFIMETKIDNSDEKIIDEETLMVN